ncbi:MAG: pyrroline-5-carboxylate reductase [Anaerolineae bacterium]|jgi:pyrroline-5-carboxylate reductase
MDSLSNIKIAFIGGGVMAEAFMRGLLGRGVSPQQITVGEPVPARRDQLAQALGVRAVASNSEAAADADVLVLAVKPQVLGRVLDDLAGRVAAETPVLSIVAGARIATIRAALGTPMVVRIMPNTPAQVGEGISVWTATPETDEAQRERAREMLAALGQEVQVDGEHYIDMATALSGSGPGYVFLFIEALVDAGVHMGFSRPVAEKLALQTVRGAVVYAQESGEHLAVLRNRVTSPGGTTAEALYELEKGGLRALVARAVWVAYERARTLGRSEDR